MQYPRGGGGGGGEYNLQISVHIYVLFLFLFKIGSLSLFHPVDSLFVILLCHIPLKMQQLFLTED